MPHPLLCNLYTIFKSLSVITCRLSFYRDKTEQSCKLCAKSQFRYANPCDYLKDLFIRLPGAKITQIMEFTPAEWAKVRAGKKVVTHAA